MAEIIHKISYAGDTFYEIVECDDGVSCIIRTADDPPQQIKLLRSVLPSLINILKKL